ncbi:uncharacterized protein BJX67DRAFT_107911 [Aspergillus lucknowensis]|uniref:Uncharacterized protein n=1 Tax=Aspergillus lucknowensis TaxID=176173 RepID=A0ABR4LSU8_9EURO
MPPKRASDAPATSSKRSKTGNSATKARSKRWSAVSASANVEASYQEHRDYNTYKCLCQARVDGARPVVDDDDDEDSEDEEDDEGSGQPRPKNPKCDDGDTCVCKKSAAENPDHPFTITTAGHEKFMHQLMHTDLRNPDFFGMFVFNDFAGYGILEVLQNLVLDFVEAEDNWKEQWAVCEAIPLYWMLGDLMPFSMLDAETVRGTWSFIGHMFVTMLANLEARGLLKPDSEVRNLGVIMALYLPMADELGDVFDYDSDVFDSLSFDAYILAYAKKYHIKLHGPSNLTELVSKIEDEFEGEDELQSELPAPSADPWKWAVAYKAYAKTLWRDPHDKEERNGRGQVRHHYLEQCRTQET